MKRRCPQTRSAFTLVELLAVMAIIGVLIALLLPAIQASRESARQMHCLAHLREIGFALHSYHDAQGEFPAGNFAVVAGVCTGAQLTSEDNPSQDHVNWAILILPYVEQGTLAARYNFSTYNEAPANREVREGLPEIYGCPSDENLDVLTVPASGPAASYDLNVPYRPGSYRAVSGRSNGLEFLDNSLVSQYPHQWRGAMHIVGILGLGRERLKDITDGTSQTLLVGESTTRTLPEYRTFWAYSYGYFSLSATTPQARTWRGDFALCKKSPGTGYSNPCARGWGSFHPNGNSFLAGDSSAKTIARDIDEKVFAAMGSIAAAD